MKKYIFWISALLILTWGGFQYWPVTVHIRGPTPEEDFSIRMPLKDKKSLEFFFREVCFLGAWSYTLAGSKPMSVDVYMKPMATFRRKINSPYLKDTLIDCFLPPSYKHIRFLFTPTQIKIKLGWEVLNKYVASHFPESRFALYTDPSNDGDSVCLTLIDKVKFIKIVKQHLEDFQTVLQNQSMAPDDLLDNKKLDTFTMCLTNDGLIGTVLGYGRENARLYQKYHEPLVTSGAWCRGEVDSENWPMISAWPEEELVNLDQLNQRTADFQPWQLEDIFYPRFACDPESEETKQLKQTYREEREKILKYYEGKDIVEATLSLFNQKVE
jgi:hypothetical protein